MGEVQRLRAELAEATGFRLARIADTMCPDGLSSAGSEFLCGVRDAVLDVWDGDVDAWPTGDVYDMVSEIADSCVPVYTRDVWATFVDLGAWDVDTEDYGDPVPDTMEQRAMVALYAIAARLAAQLAESLVDARETDSEDGGDDE